MASSKFPVAIVGMAMRLPGTNSCLDFWKRLTVHDSKFVQELVSDGYQSTTAFDDQPLDESKKLSFGLCPKPSISQANFPQKSMRIESEEHRIFLEVAWELFEDAGYASNIGVKYWCLCYQHNEPKQFSL